jgi:hypothetical protein
VVNYRTADRSGAPFSDFLEALAEYRATKGEPPIAPWVRQRICTSYLKHKVKEHYITSLGIDAYDNLVGLRADEPERVHRLKAADTQAKVFRTPLATAWIVKADVLAFWKRQAFDLQIEENQGNCTGCFLEDQSDLARVLQEPATDAAWWASLEAKYDRFGGRDFVGYDALRAEGATRLAIEAALRAGRDPVDDKTLSARRFRLVVIQERKRLRGENAGFACMCEASQVSDDET